MRVGLGITSINWNTYYIHQNGDSILYYNAELDTFALLYDFSSTAEDTVFLLEPHSFYGDSLIPLSVNNRKWIDSLGLRTFDYTYLTEHTQQTLWLFSGHVIEKIGNVGQYFFPIIGNWCDAGCGEGLRCYQDEHLSALIWYPVSLARSSPAFFPIHMIHLPFTPIPLPLMLIYRIFKIRSPGQ